MNRPWILAIPGLMLALAVVGVPLLLIVALSFGDGAANYGPLLTRDGAGLLLATLKLAVCVATLSTTCGLGIALGVKGAWRGPILGLALAPKFAGSLAVLLGLRIVLGQVAPQWTSTFAAATLAESALIIPYTVLVFVAQLDQLDPALVTSARTLGASRFQAFRRVTWPQLAPACGTAFLLALTWGLGAALGVTLFGGPRDATLGAEVYRQAFDYARPARAAGTAATMTLLAALPLALWARQTAQGT